MPNIIIIAGPNGAGKSTIAPKLLRDTFGITEYVNADTIAEGLSAFAAEEASFEAGRIMLARLRHLSEQNKDFAFETTLATRFYANWAVGLKEASGYRISLIFLWLRQVELSIARVAARVKLGGHSIPEATIRRRFERGRKNFFELYVPIADAWQIYNAGTEPASEIAKFDRVEGLQVTNGVLWNQIKK